MKGECKMKIGSAIILLLLALIILGYLLSDDINARKELDQMGQLNDQLAKEKNAIENQLGRATAEITDLRRRNETLSKEKTLLEGQITQILSEYGSVKNQNAQLQAQINTVNKGDALISHLTNLNSGSLMLSLFVPLLPISIAGGLLISRNGKSHHQSLVKKSGSTKHVLSMYVTNEEMKLIRQIRRNSSRTSR
jgi:cell division protein FtsB